MKELLIFIFFLMVYYFLANYDIENFSIPFASPPDSSSSDKSNIKDLLEIGSQANEDKKYDVVNKKILGDAKRKPVLDEEIQQEDPNCFANNNYDFDYDKLKNENSNIKPKACCDAPSKKEIDMDWNFLQESLDLDYNLGLEGDLPNCCGRN